MLGYSPFFPTNAVLCVFSAKVCYPLIHFFSGFKGSWGNKAHGKNIFSPSEPNFHKKVSKNKKTVPFALDYIFSIVAYSTIVYFCCRAVDCAFFWHGIVLTFSFVLKQTVVKKDLGVPTLPPQTLQSRHYFFIFRSVRGTMKVKVYPIRFQGISSTKITTGRHLLVTSFFLKVVITRRRLRAKVKSPSHIVGTFLLLQLK